MSPEKLLYNMALSLCIRKVSSYDPLLEDEPWEEALLEARVKSIDRSNQSKIEPQGEVRPSNADLSKVESPTKDAGPQGERIP